MYLILQCFITNIAHNWLWNNTFSTKSCNNKDEYVHRFALSAIRVELLEIQRERERETNNVKCDKKFDKKVWPKVNRLISRDLQNTNLKRWRKFDLFSAPFSYLLTSKPLNIYLLCQIKVLNIFYFFSFIVNNFYMKSKYFWVFHVKVICLIHLDIVTSL